MSIGEKILYSSESSYEHAASEFLIAKSLSLRLCSISALRVPIVRPRSRTAFLRTIVLPLLPLQVEGAGVVPHQARSRWRWSTTVVPPSHMPLPSIVQCPIQVYYAREQWRECIFMRDFGQDLSFGTTCSCGLNLLLYSPTCICSSCLVVTPASIRASLSTTRDNYSRGSIWQYLS